MKKIGLPDIWEADFRDSVGIGLGILSLLPRHDIDSNGAIWLLGLAVVLLAISRIAEMGNKAGSHLIGFFFSFVLGSAGSVALIRLAR